ncbi:hypothetical protein [Salinigranum salinum]|uniref:hypothetical protein n=1 Tax=Salinigranum salinum TaxID=1364937 RepID=UPI001260D6D4|nr:hypothetical protein [Salinigranum salinum]
MTRDDALPFRVDDVREHARLHPNDSAVTVSARPGYRSSRESGNDRYTALLRYDRAFAKADTEGRRLHPSNHPLTPDQPKGMHWDTFADLVENVGDARHEWRGVLNTRLYQLTAGERYCSTPERSLTPNV